MIYLYRTGFVILLLLLITLSLLDRIPGDTFAMRLNSDPEGWNFTYPRYESRHGPGSAQKLLIEYLAKKQHAPDTVDLLMLSFTIAAVFCLIGWIREARGTKQLKARAIAS